jgi:hypothetical protein
MPQSTLSFGGKRKVTKHTSLPGKDIKAAQPQLTPEPVKSTPKAPPVTKVLTKEEQEASKVSQARINKYWREREAERLAPRIHQEDVGTEEKILRLFDMSSQYGVSASIHIYSNVIPTFLPDDAEWCCLAWPTRANDVGSRVWVSHAIGAGSAPRSSVSTHPSRS